MIDSIMVVGALIHCASLHSVCAQMNAQHSLTEATKNICCLKVEGIVQ